MKKDIICVIGGGAAGLMAAGAAAENKACDVLLIEKNKILGKKLLITGKGRCNVTNNCDLQTVLDNIVRNNRFLYSALSNFGTADTISFFENLGVPLKTERGQRVFPVSDRSADILSALKKYIQKSNISVIHKPVADIKKNGDGFEIILSDKEKIVCKKVIVATGGLSYTATGSTGDGYRFSKLLGHTVTPLRGSLVPLVTNEKWCAALTGLSLKNVTVTLKEQPSGKEMYSEIGEMLFTHFGVSGPLILSLSAHIDEKKSYKISIDLKPGLTSEKLNERILRDFSKNLNKDLQNALYELLPRSIIPVIIENSGINPDIKINAITKEMRKKLCDTIKSLTLTVKGFRPVEEAIITSGGVNVGEINPKTMESKLVGGLYFAGEVIDVDAYTGGFNLQIAFSTGFLAGKSASNPSS